MPTATGPAAVRRLLAKRHPGIDIWKLEGSAACWYISGPGTERLYSTSLNTARLLGDPQVWVDAITALLAGDREPETPDDD